MKHLGLYIISGLLGGTIMFLIADHIFTKIEIEAMLLEDEKSKADEEEVPLQEVPEAKENKKDESFVELKKKHKEPINYNGISKPKPDLAEIVKQTIAQKEKVVNEMNTAISIITEEEYRKESTKYSNQSLVYYEEDDILVDDYDGSVIDNPEDIVGEEALLKFGDGSSDPDIVYVRNKTLALQFEIVRKKSSYSKEVLRIQPESKKPKKIKKDEE